jgi:hypothetical protein
MNRVPTSPIFNLHGCYLSYALLQDLVLASHKWKHLTDSVVYINICPTNESKVILKEVLNSDHVKVMSGN